MKPLTKLPPQTKSSRSKLGESAFPKVLAAWCREHGLPLPIAEWQFHPTRRWKFDFGWGRPHFVALEIEGGVYAKGRHTRGKGYEGDCEKYNAAALLNWRVFRVTTGMVKSGKVWPLLEQALRK